MSKLSLAKDEEDYFTALVIDALDHSEVRGERREKALQWLSTLLLNVALLNLLSEGKVEMSWDDNDETASWKITDSGAAEAIEIMRKAKGEAP
jgi:hypothetical protein